MTRTHCVECDWLLWNTVHAESFKITNLKKKDRVCVQISCVSESIWPGAAEGDK